MDNERIHQMSNSPNYMGGVEKWARAITSVRLATNIEEDIRKVVMDPSIDLLVKLKLVDEVNEKYRANIPREAICSIHEDLASNSIAVVENESENESEKNESEKNDAVAEVK